MPGNYRTSGALALRHATGFLELGLKGEKMRAARLQELEEMGTKLQATALELPSGQDRHNALREIERFRARITALHAFDFRRADGGLKARK
jgi:hypothetical protein